MAAETNLEREFKFDVDPDFDPPDLRPLVGRTERLPEQHLTTTYFDTPDRRLWELRITLRHRLETEGDRKEGGIGKWTLKLPLAAGAADDDRMARDEFSWKGDRSEVPEEAARIVAGVVRRASLEPVVMLETHRRRLLMHPDGGEGPWGEIDDDLVAVTSGGREGLRFRQIELELIGADGHPGGDVETVLGALRRAGALPGGGSKFALAAGLDGDDGTEAPATDLRTLAAGTLRRDLGLVLEADCRLRIPDGDGDPAGLDAEAVRQADLATRRMRAHVSALGAVLDPVWVKHAEADLGWLGGLLGRLREEDVLAERIRAGGEHGDERSADAAGELLRLFRSDRHLGATELCEALASDRYADMVDRLHAGAGNPPVYSGPGYSADGPLEGTLRSAVTAGWRVVRAEMDDLDSEPDDEALDHLRVHAKRLRYAAELAEPHLGKPARRTAEKAARLQEVLSGLRNSAHASRTLRELASHPSVTPPVAFVAGYIAGRAEAEAGWHRRDWRKAAKKLCKVGRDSWPG